ncbi:MAG TPA: type II toxin-antitoxin system VapC family toxin [Caulobacteraceae bacterium]|nr:type II toxin-antitoxin system VapC family toxin [Caulobacteraceae bacterium]
MRLLFDTHILIAIIEGRANVLPERLRGLIEDPAGAFHVSVVSLWEIAIKHRLGKLKLSTSLHALPQMVASMGMELMPIIAGHVLAAIQPEPPTHDPFDRLLLAQCQCEGLRLVTLDRALASHPLAASGR